MSHFIHQTAFYIHVVLGSLALVIFWLPIFAKKGSQNHVRFGNYFVAAMYTVSITGLIMSVLVLIDPVAVRLYDTNMPADELARIIYRNRIFAMFLLMLSLLVLSNTRHSILVLKAKNDRTQLRSSAHLSLVILLGVTGFITAIYGIMHNILLFQIFASLSVFNSLGLLRYIFKSHLQKREWIIEHLGNIIGSGIGAYTAFFAFGGRRLFEQLLTGNLQVIPWVIPGVVGVVSTIYLAKKYRKQYRVA